MPSSTPPPGHPAAPPRRGMGGLLGLLAVLAFVILAVVIATRREPGRVAEAPPATPAASAVLPPSPLPSEVAPSTDPGTPAASPEPSGLPAESPAPATTSRPRRTAASPGGQRVAAADAPGLRGSGSRLPGAPPPRRFILGTTSIENLKPVGRDLAGFEAGSVGVKRAPEVNGRLELEMDPSQVRPGVDYRVKVFLANDGNKDIPVQHLKISTVENGKTASRTASARARTVKPRQRVLLQEIEGVWRENARSWAMDVVVTSSRQDVYRNRLRWE